MILKRRGQYFYRSSKLPTGGFDDGGNAALPGKAKAMLRDGPQRRVQLCENEANPLVAVRAVLRAGRRQQPAPGRFLGHVHAYRGRLGDDRPTVIQYGDLAAGIDLQKPRLPRMAAHDVNLDVFVVRTDFFECPQCAKSPAISITVEIHRLIKRRLALGGAFEPCPGAMNGRGG